MKTVNYFFLGLLALSVGCGNNRNTSDAYGNFTATEILISAESAGKVIGKYIDEGTLLKSNDIAYVIDTVQNSLKKDELVARKRSILAKSSGFTAQIEVLNEQAKSLENDLDRFTKMFKDGASTRKQLDDLTTQLDVVRKQIIQVKTNFASVDADASATNASIAQVEDMIRRSVVTSPTKGTVLETYAEIGESVIPGKPLFKIADLDEMELKAYFSGRQLPLLKIGNKVDVFTDDGNGNIRQSTGIIDWISSEAEFTPKIIQTREERLNLVYAVKVRVKNDGSIKINMPGEVKIVSSVK
jgi:HlyD family secretion protein